MRAWILAILTLAGCAEAPVAVKIPVPVSCLPAGVPARPAMAENAALKAMDDRKMLLTIAAERLEQGAYAAQAEALIQGCR